MKRPLWTLTGLAMFVGTVNADFIDDFSDGIVAPRYTALGDATVTEAGGVMSINMPGTGDGVSIFLADVASDANCFTGEYFVSGFVAGSGMQVDFMYDYVDDAAGPFTAFRYVIAQTNSVKASAQAFDKDGNLLQEANGITFEDCNHEGAWKYQLDFVDGKWVFDGGENVVGTDCVVKAILDNPDIGKMYTDYLTNTLRASSVVVTSRNDPVVDFDIISALRVAHVPEPSGVMLLGVGLLGMSLRLLRRK